METEEDARKPLLVAEGDFREPYGSTHAQVITLTDGNILAVPKNELPNGSDPLPVGGGITQTDTYGNVLTTSPPTSGPGASAAASSVGVSHLAQENIPDEPGTCQLAPENRGTAVSEHVQQAQPQSHPSSYQPDPMYYQPPSYQSGGMPQYPGGQGQYAYSQYPNPVTYQDPQYNIQPGQYQPYPPPATTAYAQPFQGQVQPPAAAASYYPYQDQMVQQQQPQQYRLPPKESSHTSFDMKTNTLHRNQLFIAVALLIVSIVCLNFCLLPCTVTALVFAFKAATSNSEQGQVAEAKATQYHTQAKFCNIATMLSLVLIAILIVVTVIIIIIVAKSDVTGDTHVVPGNSSNSSY